MPGPVVILGLGFTTQRLARRLRQRNIPVYAAVRQPERFSELESKGVRVCPMAANKIPPGATLVHSIPPLARPETDAIHSLITAIGPRRILYISSTGIYGSQTDVDANTAASPNNEKGHARLAEESWMTEKGAPLSTLILRSAAIYGPGRGVHVRLREGNLPRGTGGVVSRIHVEDLVSLLEAGAASELNGAWPVADDCPASSEEVVAFCASQMGISLPENSPRHFPVSGRRVNGKKIRELLGVTLLHPSYRSGIPASLREEQKDGD